MIIKIFVFWITWRRWHQDLAESNSFHPEFQSLCCTGKHHLCFTIVLVFLFSLLFLDAIMGQWVSH